MRRTSVLGILKSRVASELRNPSVNKGLFESLPRHIDSLTIKPFPSLPIMDPIPGVLNISPNYGHG
jgi:hypothetical protein